MDPKTWSSSGPAETTDAVNNPPTFLFQALRSFLQTFLDTLSSLWCHVCFPGEPTSHLGFSLLLLLLIRTIDVVSSCREGKKDRPQPVCHHSLFTGGVTHTHTLEGYSSQVHVEPFLQVLPLWWMLRSAVSAALFFFFSLPAQMRLRRGRPTLSSSPPLFLSRPPVWVFLFAPVSLWLPPPPAPR